MALPETIRVAWYNCNCDYTTKYCDENHRSYSSIPMSVVLQYSK